MSGLFRIAGWNRATIFVLAVLVLLGVLIARNLHRAGGDSRLANIRAHGFPATLKDLDEWYLPVPPDENLALKCEQAFSEPAFTNSASTFPTKQSWLPNRGQNLSAKDLDEISALLATNEPALRLLHALPADGRSRYPIDIKQGAMTLLPHLAQARQATILLGAEAMYHAAQHQPHEAIESLLTAGRVADTLAEEPLLISYLVCNACWDIIGARLELILRLNEVAESDLAAMQKAIAHAERPGGLTRVLAAERAFGISIFTDADQQIGVFTSFTRTPSRKDYISRDLSLALFKATGLYKKDLDFYMAALATNIAAAQCPFPERFPRGQAAATFSSRVPNRLCVVSRMMLPALGNMFSRNADFTARVHVLLTVVAVERYRRAHGEKLPATLEELVPAYLAKVPADPYDGSSVRFKLLRIGYAIYSVGSDLRDDGGVTPEGTNSTPNLKVPQDITIIVERPS